MSIYVTPRVRPFYGAFQDTTTQSAASTTAAYATKFNTTDFADGVSVVTDGTNPTRITVANKGIYDIQFSLQFANTSASSEQDIDVWFRINGTDINGSNGQVTIDPSHGGTSGKIMAAWNFFADFQSGDYFQLMWRTTSTDVTMATIASQINPTRPSTASAIVSVTQIS